LAGVGALWGASEMGLRGIWSLFVDSFSEIQRFGVKNDLSIESVKSILFFSEKVFLWSVGPILLAAWVVSAVVGFIQTGFVFTTRSLELDLEKLSPLKGLSRMVSIESLFEMFKALIKFLVVSACVYPFLKTWIKEANGLYAVETGTLVRFLGTHLLKILLVLSLAMTLVAVADWIFQKLRYEKRIRMTKEEVKEERKQMEGNPQIKAKIRQMQRAASRRKMMQDVRKADVVITNPTHFAVALIYDREAMFAPKVVAKGTDHMALRIKEVARLAGVPVVENPPLARALYKALKIGQFISKDLYNAVAEVLAYVYRLKGRMT
jgi:flagellar biosynthetic protein FlhB